MRARAFAGLFLAVAALAPKSGFADAYSWSYEDASGASFSGTLEGTPIAFDRVQVSQVTVTHFAGYGFPAFPVLSALSDLVSSSGLPPVVSFSGSFMDLGICSEASCTVDFIFIGDLSALTSHDPGFWAGLSSFEISNEAFDPERWKLIPLDPSFTSGTYHWSYRSNTGDRFSGTLEGTGAGVDHVVVSSFEVSEWSIHTPPGLSVVSATSDLVSSSGLQPTVSVSGSFMDFAACSESTCAADFLLTGDLSLFTGFDPAFYAGASGFEYANEQFEAERWRLIPPFSEPQPVGMLPFGASALLMLVLGRATARFAPDRNRSSRR